MCLFYRFIGQLKSTGHCHDGEQENVQHSAIQLKFSSPAPPQ